MTVLRLKGGTTGDNHEQEWKVIYSRCKACNETLGHILGQCVYTKAQWIRRRDEIRDFVSKKLVNMKIQIIEVLIPTPKCNLKPDLVLINEGRVHVVDVTVRHEDTG